MFIWIEVKLIISTELLPSASPFAHWQFVYVFRSKKAPAAAEGRIPNNVVLYT